MEGGRERGRAGLAPAAALPGRHAWDHKLSSSFSPRAISEQGAGAPQESVPRGDPQLSACPGLTLSHGETFYSDIRVGERGREEPWHGRQRGTGRCRPHPYPPRIAAARYRGCVCEKALARARKQQAMLASGARGSLSRRPPEHGAEAPAPRSSRGTGWGGRAARCSPRTRIKAAVSRR